MRSSNFPALCWVRFLKTNQVQGVPRYPPTERFPCVTSEECAWNACCWLVLERGVTLLLLQDLVWLGNMCCVWSLLPCEPVYKLGQGQCQVRLLCDFVCEVLCVRCSVSVQQRHYHESTDKLTFSLLGRPYTLQSNFKPFGKQWRFTGRCV